MSLRRVEIAVRVRAPDNPHDSSCVSLHQSTHQVVVEDGSGTGRRSYKEDLLFDEHVSNDEIFEALVRSKMTSTSPEQPDTLCFLAYGHTSSGKTYSIAGTDEEPGILRLCVEDLLRREGVVEVSMLEVYMDAVNDLLAEGQPRQIRRRQTPHGAAIVVEGLTTCSLTSAEQWKAVSAYGMRSRRTAPTERNARSSRSHAIFTVKSRSVRLCLVDLAGSERQTVFSPQLNRESISINKSLSRLSTVLEALSSQRVTEDGRRSYVNFRDTTLTVLLQRYLTGASLTTFLACVHPGTHNVQETLSTLRYTQRLKRIRTRGAAAGAAEWSGLKPVENQDLLDELMRLRERVRVSENTSRLVEAAQQRRIAELESTVAAQQIARAASASAPALNDGPVSTVGSSAAATVSGRARDTRRVAGWLLSRVLGDLPELNVGYDDYFDGFFPPSIQVIGYVSTMAGLVPRTADADPLAFLDVGDLAMGLSMLDAGIPPFVRLHRAGCAEPSAWEGQEWEDADSVVYVLAFFEYHRTAMTAAGDDAADDSDAALACCGGFLTSAPLLPIATVLCVAASTTRRVKEEVLQRLIDLQCEQQEAVDEQAGVRTDTAPSHDDDLPVAADLLDASLNDDDDGGSSRNDAADAEGVAQRRDRAAAAAARVADTSLLAQEVQRQAVDTSHIVTPYKESSSSAGSSRASTPPPADMPPASAMDGGTAAVDVRRDLLHDFCPAEHSATASSKPASPPPPPHTSDEPVKPETRHGAALPHKDDSGAPSKTSVSAAAAQDAQGAVPPRRGAPSTSKLPPPPSPPSPPAEAAAVTPPLSSKKHRKEKNTSDKTARRNGCSGCHGM